MYLSNQDEDGMICVECESEFNHRDPSRRRAGGRINTCLDCCDETVVRYAGVAGSDGKQASVSILRFQSAEDRKEYLEYWKVNSGLYKGKSCQIGRGVKSTTNVKFQTVAVFEGNVNAKGKA